MTGEFLKNEIKRRGYTLRAVADRMKKTEQSVGRMLTSSDVSSSLMEAAAEVMGISVADFYRQSEAPSPSVPAKDPNSFDARLLDIIHARDRQIDKCQAQLDKAQQQIDHLLQQISKQ
jgi:transcriptional regulator with XRE-family HTH domain